MASSTKNSPVKRRRLTKRKIVVVSSESEPEDIHDTLEDEVELQERRSRPEIESPGSEKLINDCNGTDSKQWIDKYLPISLSDLCINPQKLKQVRTALQHMISGTSTTKLLVLSGPAGCSKSTTIKVLANELVNSPTSIGTQAVNRDIKWIEYVDSLSVHGLSQPGQFLEFLDGARLLTGSNLAVIIIEELPNVFHPETLAQFRSSLQKWVSSALALPPLVLCLTEVEHNSGDGYRRLAYSIENNFNSETLLLKSLASHPCVLQIKFNPIANRFMTKTLKLIVSAERALLAKLSTTAVQKFLTEAAKTGDVRCAIQNMQMWSKHWTTRVPESRSKSRHVPLLDLSVILATNQARETSIDLFHAIGKIIYSSSEFSTSETMSNSSVADYMSVEKVLQLFKSDNMDLLKLALLENYGLFQDSTFTIEIAASISNDLSASDTMATVDGIVGVDEVALYSVRHNLRKAGANTLSAVRNHHAARPKFPRHYKMQRRFRDTERQVMQYLQWVNMGRSSFDEINMVDGCLVPRILNSQLHHGGRYERLGGPFREVVVSDVSDHEVEDDTTLSGDLNHIQRYIDAKIHAARSGGGEEEQKHGCYYDDEELSDPIDSNSDVNYDSDEFLSDPELDVMISQGQV